MKWAPLPLVMAPKAAGVCYVVAAEDSTSLPGPEPVPKSELGIVLIDCC